MRPVRGAAAHQNSVSAARPTASTASTLGTRCSASRSRGGGGRPNWGSGGYRGPPRGPSPAPRRGAPRIGRVAHRRRRRRRRADRLLARLAPDAREVRGEEVCRRLLGPAEADPPGFRSSEGMSTLRPLLASEPGDVSELVLQAFMRGLHHAAPGRTYSAPAAIFDMVPSRDPGAFARFEGDLRWVFGGSRGM